MAAGAAVRGGHNGKTMDAFINCTIKSSRHFQRQMMPQNENMPNCKPGGTRNPIRLMN
jgi:hypothetical protein